MDMPIETEEFPKKVLAKMIEDGYQLDTPGIQIDNGIMEIRIAQKKIAWKLMILYLSYFELISSLKSGVAIVDLLERVTEEIDRSLLNKRKQTNSLIFDFLY